MDYRSGGQSGSGLTRIPCVYLHMYIEYVCMYVEVLLTQKNLK